MQSCKHESWIGVAKYLMDDVPHLLKSEDVKDMDSVLSILCTSLPSDFGKFIQWFAEVRRERDGGIGISEEEKGRLAIKVWCSVFIFICCFMSLKWTFVLLRWRVCSFSFAGRTVKASSGYWSFQAHSSFFVFNFMQQKRTGFWWQ